MQIGRISGLASNSCNDAAPTIPTATADGPSQETKALQNFQLGIHNRIGQRLISAILHQDP
jgi:hypothetical protein